jgi:anti-anti-sigma regulatory factor
MSANAPEARDVTPIAGAVTLSIEQGRVLLNVQGAVDFQVWRAIRDAREAALENKVPLHIDLGACTHMDCGGFGALLLAADRLGEIVIKGCGDRHAAYLNVLRVCEVCKGDSAAHCSKNAGPTKLLRDWLPQCEKPGLAPLPIRLPS